ncbi:hypothetical protein [Pseudosulfitobacter pseudonitzschiae]|uniref:hypothetical protein n=1 Tax=Pseudosulfitobacter pseudonitzschiae TaxID=1402135 RepID=UPI00177E0A6E|nr:hypothetical protein [Pseudosulfitobacter pseudonitzschiae]
MTGSRGSGAPATDGVGPLARAHRVLRLIEGRLQLHAIALAETNVVFSQADAGSPVLTDRTAEHDAFARIAAAFSRTYIPNPTSAEATHNPLGVPSVQQTLNHATRKGEYVRGVRTTSGSVTPKQSGVPPGSAAAASGPSFVGAKADHRLQPENVDLHRRIGRRTVAPDLLA